MLSWTLWQFGNVVSDAMAEAEKDDVDLWAEMEARLFSLMESGNQVAWPASEPVGHGTGLFALRARSNTRQSRLLYFFMSGKRIVFVHSVSKKTRKFQQHDIDLAARRKQQIERADDLKMITTQFIVNPNDHQTH